jgi:hypothetical protein
MEETTTNSKPPGPIIMIRQSETLNGSQIIIFYIIFVHWGFHQPLQT